MGQQAPVERDEYMKLRDAADALGYETRSLYDPRVLRRLGLQLYKIEATGSLRLRRADVLKLVVTVD